MPAIGFISSRRPNDRARNTKPKPLNPKPIVRVGSPSNMGVSEIRGTLLGSSLFGKPTSWGPDQGSLIFVDPT